MKKGRAEKLQQAINLFRDRTPLEVKAFEAIPCRCGWKSCKAWQVSGTAPEAKYTERQARGIADLLNKMEEPTSASIDSFIVQTGRPG